MSRRKWTVEEIQEYRKNNGGVFYYNSEDSNLFVPKAFGMGRTLNWGNPISWIVILLVVAFIFFRRFI